MNLLWAFIPDEALVLVLVLAGFLFLLGFRGLASGLLGTVIVWALIGSFVDSLIDSLPTWVVVIAGAIIMLTLFRWVLTLCFGGQAAGEFIGRVIYDVFLLPFRVVGLFFRMLGHLWRR